MPVYDFAIAHCNFQLRENDSERDEQFVRDLAAKYSRPIHVKRFETKLYAVEKKISTQEAARELRYGWFEEVCQSDGYQYLLTAHHADDNIETAMMNFFRGTGIKGIRGIAPKQGRIIRPLLFARRRELESFLDENRMDYVLDYTNEEDDYTRNFFRNKIIPMIEKAYPGARENVLANIDRFKETEQLYQQAIAVHKKKLLETRENEVHIPVLKLKKAEPLHSIVYEIIQEYGFSPGQVNEVIALLNSESGKYVQSATHRIIRNRNWLIIAGNQHVQAGFVLIEGPGNWETAIGTIGVATNDARDFKPPASNNMAALDAAEIKFPLLFRKWKAGDYFYPLGMRKKKKLSRFFIDQKLSKTDKEKAWVIEMDKKIIWIPGYRIDDRFKITPKTRQVLVLSSTKLD